MPTPAQVRNPLHGLTLEQLLTALVAQYGWPGLAERIPVRCFSHDPSMGSSLRFLRKTAWAREKVEGLYLFTQRRLRAQALHNNSHAAGRNDAGASDTGDHIEL